MLPEIVDGELIPLIGRIYDAVIDPTRWYGTIDAIRLRYNFPNAMLSLVRPAEGRLLLNLEVNIPLQYQNMLDSYYIGEYAKLWGGPQRLFELPLEEPLILSEAAGDEGWPTNGYYLDFAKPQDLDDLVAIHLLRDDTVGSGIGFGHHASAPYPTAAELDELRILAPHLRRALTIAGILDTASAAAATFQVALDATQAGVVLVDDTMKIVHANAAAQAMLDKADPIEDLKGRLALSEELVAGQLRSAVQLAATDEAVLSRRGIAIPTRDMHGTPLMVHVMPLERRIVRGGISARAAAAVFVAQTTSAPPPRAEALELLFDLTPAEARVFELVVAGHTSEQIAARLGVAASTFRTHLQRVFGKTGQHSRADLLRLARTIVLPS